MGLPPQITKINSYVNGSEIYFSDILPFSLEDVTELDEADISIIISFQSESIKPYYFNHCLRNNPNIRHYYYSLDENVSEERIYKLFDTVYSNIYYALEKGLKILLQCRDGIHLNMTFFIAFLLRAIYGGAQQYALVDYWVFVPKTKLRWTDSICEFFYERLGWSKEKYLTGSFMKFLYVYENNLVYFPPRMSYYRYFS